MLSQPFPPAFDAAIDRAYKHQLSLLHGQPSTEILICLSKDGAELIDESFGGHDKVQLTEKMKVAGHSAKGCCLVHNHPKRGSLSAADWRLTLEYTGIHEIVAVNCRKSVFRGAPNRSQSSTLGSLVSCSDLSEQIGEKVFQKLWDKHNKALSDCLQLPSPSSLQKALAWVWSHLVNERFREKCYVAYSAELSADDKNELIHPNFACIIEDGRNEIAVAVK